jgi:hypothetical protein
MLLVAAGARVRVSAVDPDVRAAVASAVAPLLAERARPAADDGQVDGGSQLEVRVDGTGPWEVHAEQVGRHVRAMDRVAAVSATLDAINLLALREGPHLALHAAVVARDGAALVLPGPSGLGKSTLTGALLARGWTYVSDEALVLPWEGGDAVAYPRTLALSRWSADRLGVQGTALADEVLVTPQDLGGGAAAPDDRFPVAGIALMERSGPSAERPVVAGVAADVVLRELLARCFNHYRDPARALSRLADLVATARTGRFVAGSPERTAHAVDDWWSGASYAATIDPA